ADETAPWATYNKGKPISQRQVAGLLKPYGIKPKTIRLDDGGTPKGYMLEWFADVFSRFCFSSPQTPDSIRHCATDLFSQDFSPFSSATGPTDVADKNDGRPFDINGCGGVASENQGEAGKEDREADLAALGRVLREWDAAVGIGQRCTLDQLIELAFDHCAGLRAALLTVASMDDGVT